MTRLALPLSLLLFSSCAAGSGTAGSNGPAAPVTPVDPASPRPAPRAEPLVRSFGTLREIFREGHAEGRVELLDELGPHTVGLGALEDLAAEITVFPGQALLAEVVDAASPQGLRVRAPALGDRAALLVLADVETWTARELPAVPDLDALEDAVRALAEASGIDASEPFPFRVEGTAREIRFHVFDHSCPIAHPEGPPPWRFTGADEAVALVGFFAEGAGGRLTHHGWSTHTHARLARRDVAGHLDEVSFAPGARLFLPAR